MKPSAGGNARVAIFAIVVCAVMAFGAGASLSHSAIASQTHFASTLSTSPKPTEDSSQSDVAAPAGTVTTITMSTSGGNNLVYASGMGKVFVQAEDIDFISTTTNSVVGGIYVGNNNPVISDMVYDTGRGEVFASNWYGSLIVINATSDAVVANISLASLYGEGNSCLVGGTGFLSGLTYDSARAEIWILTSCGVAIISDTDYKLVTTITADGLHNAGCIAYDGGKGEVFVQMFGSVYGFSDSTYDQISQIQLPYGFNGQGWNQAPCIAYDPSKSEIFVSNFQGNSSGTARAAVTVISDKTDAIIANLLTGADPGGLAFDAAAGAVFVANYGSNDVSEINDTTNAVVANETAGNRSADVAFDPSDNELFVSNPNLWIPGKPSYGQVNVISLPLVNNVPSLFSVVLTPSLILPWQMGINQTVFFNTTVFDTANSSYTFRYSESQGFAGCDFSSVANIECTPTSYGEFNVSVNVSDAKGNSATVTSPNITVLRASVVLTTSQATIGINAAVSFTATIFNPARSAYTYRYSESASFADCHFGNVSVVACNPTSAGTFAVSVTVTDSFGNSASTTSPIVTVLPASVALTPSRTEVDVKESLSLIATISDPANSSYAYQYSASGSFAGCTFANASSVKCVPTSNGTFNVSVKVTDRFGNSANATSPTITVLPAMRATFITSNSTPLLGQTIALVVNVSGGLAPYSYSYLGLPPGCVSINTSAIGCLPTQAGYYNASVVVTDSLGANVSVVVSIHIVFDFNVVVPAKTSVGSPLTIRVNIDQPPTSDASVMTFSGGYGTLTYDYSGLPPGCTDQDVAVLTCTPTQTGMYNVTISVHDQVGDHNTHTVVVNVVPASSTPGTLGLSGDTGYLVIGGAIAVAAIIAGILVLRRRGRSRPPSSIKREEQDAQEKRPATDDEGHSSDAAVEKASEIPGGIDKGTVTVSRSDWEDMKSRLDKLEKKGP